MSKIRTMLLGATAIAGLAGGTAHARAPSVETRLDEMERTIQMQKREIEDLKAQQAAREAAGQSGEVATKDDLITLQQSFDKQVADAKTSPKVKFKKGRPTISSADGKNSLSIRSEVMLDWGGYDKGSVNTSSGVQSIRSGANFRRAQLGIEGKVAGDFGYKLIYEFGGAGAQEAGANSKIKEAFISYNGILDPFTFKIGAFAPPANLSDAMSSADQFFVERPSAATIGRGLAGDDARYAVGFQGSGHMWNASFYVTGDTAGTGAVDSQRGFIGRVAFAPIQDKSSNLTLHIGGNYTRVMRPQEAAVGSYPLRLRDRPELRIWNVRLIDSGSIESKSLSQYAVELAGSWGPFTVQGEKYWFDIDRRNPVAGQSDPSFDGWYVEGGWVVTGEPRKYKMDAAAFGKPSPVHEFSPLEGQWGAWELAGRYSVMDLNHHATAALAADRVAGGEQKIWAVGLNFYPNDVLKFMFDYQNVDIMRGYPVAVKSEFNAFVLRSQFSF